LWGVFGGGALRRLLLGGGATGFHALDSFLFGGATAPDVRLHRGYNPIGGDDLQYSARPGSIRRLIAIPHLLAVQLNEALLRWGGAHE
jgi:hypothetical protein